MDCRSDIDWAAAGRGRSNWISLPASSTSDRNNWIVIMLQQKGEGLNGLELID